MRCKQKKNVNLVSCSFVLPQINLTTQGKTLRDPRSIRWFGVSAEIATPKSTENEKARQARSALMIRRNGRSVSCQGRAESVCYAFFV